MPQKVRSWILWEHLASTGAENLNGPLNYSTLGPVPRRLRYARSAANSHNHHTLSDLGLLSYRGKTLALPVHTTGYTREGKSKQGETNGQEDLEEVKED
jgi:hypothetical protein